MQLGTSSYTFRAPRSSGCQHSTWVAVEDENHVFTGHYVCPSCGATGEAVFPDPWWLDEVIR